MLPSHHQHKAYRSRGAGGREIGSRLLTKFRGPALARAQGPRVLILKVVIIKALNNKLPTCHIDFKRGTGLGGSSKKKFRLLPSGLLLSLVFLCFSFHVLVLV